MLSEYPRPRTEFFSSQTLGPRYFPIICVNGVRSHYLSPKISDIVQKEGYISAPYVGGGGIFGLSSPYFTENAKLLAEHVLLRGKIINVAGKDTNEALIAGLHKANHLITIRSLTQIISFVYYPGTPIGDYERYIISSL